MFSICQYEWDKVILQPQKLTSMKTEMKVLLYLKRNEQSEKDMCPLMGRDGKDFHQGTLQLNGTVLVQDESGFQNLECHFSTLYG